MRLVECVPNFSEGRNDTAIGAIAGAVSAVPDVFLLDVDKGWGANRTVVTFAGEPEPVLEAAFQAIKRAANVIDMRLHNGAHPRVGATDVCPFVPLAGVDMAECVTLANRLGERVAAELDLPVFLYEEAARLTQRRSLPDVRRGEYEGLAERFKVAENAPDFGQPRFNAKSGATIVGARQILVAFNVNLNTESRTIATRIAGMVRETGRIVRDGVGRSVLTVDGASVREPGTLKSVRAVGWYIQEYNCVQVSTNVLDFRETGLHHVYEEVRRCARGQGVDVTGSELIGMVPLSALVSAGKFYAGDKAEDASETELVELAVSEFGLRKVRRFSVHEKVLEYKLRRLGVDVI